MNTLSLSATDRTVLNRFCLSIATKIIFSTNCLRQPFNSELLQSAFAEYESKVQQRISKLKNNLKNFDSLEFDNAIISYFGGKPEKAEYAEYIDILIKQEQEVAENIKNCYHISVDNEFESEDARNLHKSFNPKVTFGYSNQLHEQCCVFLTPELKKLFLRTDLCKRATFDLEERSFGSFFLPESGCFYEDCSMYSGDRLIMETVSHERIYNLYLSDNELEDFLTFENKEKRNSDIIKKLLKSAK